MLDQSCAFFCTSPKVLVTEVSLAYIHFRPAATHAKPAASEGTVTIPLTLASLASSQASKTAASPPTTLRPLYPPTPPLQPLLTPLTPANMGKLNKLLQKLTGSNKPSDAIPAPPPSLPPNTFYHVQLGSGGTFTGPSALGTSACLNTVGVYFEISPTQAFCAHIDAFVTRPYTLEVDGGPGRKFYKTNYLSASAIRGEIFARLDKEAAEYGWGRRNARMRETLLLCCKRMHAPGGESTQVADTVAKAVMEWVGAKQQPGEGERGAKVCQGAGVVCEGIGKVRRVFAEGIPGWTAVDAEVGEGWSFGVVEKRVGGVEGSEKGW